MKRISAMDLTEEKVFDFVFDDVLRNKEVYTICVDEECKQPSVVLMPIEAYNQLIDFDDGK